MDSSICERRHLELAMFDRDSAQSTWAYLLFFTFFFSFQGIENFNRYGKDGSGFSLLFAVLCVFGTLYYLTQIYQKIASRR